MDIIKLINHSSVLIKEKDCFILTDPWFERPAFGSWLPVPPTSVHPSYLVALSKTVDNFCILISHGHDDHLDDDLLSLFPKDTTIILPKYRSKGTYFRVKNIGFTNILEVPREGASWKHFEIKSFINSDISGDDAILTISGKTKFIVHANDNWQPLTQPDLATIKQDASKHLEENRIYMSQCNLADGWPNIYKDYGDKQKKEIHSARVERMIVSGLNNAQNVGILKFLNYAGYAACFIKGKEHLREVTSYQSSQVVTQLAKSIGSKVEVLDMLPGDHYDFNQIHNQFQDIVLGEKQIKESSYEFYDKYKRVLNCNSYRKSSLLTNVQLKSGLDNFLNQFKQFVEERVQKYNFNSDIVDYKISFVAPNAHSTIEMSTATKKSCTFHVSNSVASSLLTGEINWEHLYVGYDSEISTSPKNTNIRAVIRWLSMYGYKFQREPRSV